MRRHPRLPSRLNGERRPVAERGEGSPQMRTIIGARKPADGAQGRTEKADLQELLLGQMAELRRRIDPEVLEQARRAAQPASTPRPPDRYDADGNLLVDRESVIEAVRQCLTLKDDGGQFQRRLMQAMKKKSDA